MRRSWQRSSIKQQQRILANSKQTVRCLLLSTSSQREWNKWQIYRCNKFVIQHLIYSGMYKNASLNTTADKDRWLNGSKDWMEHLGWYTISNNITYQHINDVKLRILIADLDSMMDKLWRVFIILSEKWMGIK